MVGGCRWVGEWNTGRSRWWQIAIATPSSTAHPTGMHIIWDRNSVCKAVLCGIQSRGVGRTWSCSRGWRVWWSSAVGSMSAWEGKEFSFFPQLASNCRCGRHIKCFLVLFEHTGLRASLDSWSTSHDECSVVLARVSSNILSESVPPMNSNESGRKWKSVCEGGGFEDVGLSVCALPLQILVLGFQRTEFQRSAGLLKVSGGQR